MISIYNKNGKYKITLNYNKNEFVPEWYPEFEVGDIVTEEYIQFPKLVDGKLVEKTREERILDDGEVDLLVDGEIVENGKIVVVEKPQNKYLDYVWDRNKFTWEISTTKEELINMRKEAMIEYAKTKNDIELIENLSGEFENDDALGLLKNKAKQLKADINALLDIINTI